MTEVRPRGFPVLKIAVVLAACAVLSGVAASESQAAANLTKRQTIAKGDAICRATIGELARLAPAVSMASMVAKGDRWLAINRRTLRKLRALRPPAADRAQFRRMTTLADRSINKGIVGVIAAARTRDPAKFVAAARRGQAMINAAHRAARAYGFRACARW
jgi:hypothetical protein